MDQEDFTLIEELNNSLSLSYANIRCVVQNRQRFNEIFQGSISIEETYLLMEGMEKLFKALAGFKGRRV